MRRKVLILLFLIVLQACHTVPVTQRKQFNLLPESTLVSMSLENYQTVLSQKKVVRNTRETRMINEVGRKISRAVDQFLINNNYKKLQSHFDWEFNLIRENVANAWCMPGGKVAFYTGILPICKNRDGIAVVMGHEIAHAVAKHGNERLSQVLAVQMGGVALNVALQEKEKETRDLFMAAYGVGAQVGLMLPYSRLHESEADQMGLYFMTMAGYEPEEAVAFWKRMDAHSGNQPPEFLSTHPSHEKRIENLKRYVAEAKKFAQEH